MNAPTAPAVSVLPPGPALPTDACCRACGYRLVGLHEPRCPECGHAFDFAEYANSFAVRWPGMMVWVLAAILIPWLLAGPYFAVQLAQTLRKGLLNTLRSENYFLIPGYKWIVGEAVAHILLAVTLGSAAMIGLLRRRDWGRRLTVVVLLLFSLGCVITTLAALVDLWRLRPYVEQVLTQPNYTVSMWLSQQSWAVFGDAVNKALCYLGPYLALAWFLTTGLRPHSLARRGERWPPRLSKNQYNPRHDWAMLLVILLSWTVLIEAALVFHEVVAIVRNRGLPWQRGPYSALNHVGRLLALGAVIWGPYALRRMWREPGRERQTAIRLGTIVLASQTFVVASSLWYLLRSVTNKWSEIIGFIGQETGPAILVSAILVVLSCRAGRKYGSVEVKGDTNLPQR